MRIHAIKWHVVTHYTQDEIRKKNFMTDELFPRKKSLIICSSTVIPTPEKTINIKMSMNIMNNKEKMVFFAEH